MARRVSCIQPALPTYRLDFFRRVHDALGGAFQVFFSRGSLGALTEIEEVPWATEIGPIRPVLGVFLWQTGLQSLPVSPGDVVVVAGNARNLAMLMLLVRVRFRGARSIWWGHNRSEPQAATRAA